MLSMQLANLWLTSQERSSNSLFPVIPPSSPTINERSKKDFTPSFLLSISTLTVPPQPSDLNPLALAPSHLSIPRTPQYQTYFHGSDPIQLFMSYQLSPTPTLHNSHHTLLGIQVKSPMFSNFFWMLRSLFYYNFQWQRDLQFINLISHLALSSNSLMPLIITPMCKSSIPHPSFPLLLFAMENLTFIKSFCLHLCTHILVVSCSHFEFRIAAALWSGYTSQATHSRLTQGTIVQLLLMLPPSLLCLSSPEDRNQQETVTSFLPLSMPAPTPSDTLLFMGVWASTIASLLISHQIISPLVYPKILSPQFSPFSPTSSIIYSPLDHFSQYTKIMLLSPP